MFTVISFLAIWAVLFLVVRLFSFLAGTWSPFGKTYWKKDVIITLAQSVVILLLLEIM
ncbi:hypothetical protein [Peribacillus kribbensis]|uniref:hypothetical protein n=1 Tax=Peribacillus kribbensis TaxID=356658 RepID=UPI0012DF0225|nr:hypothetical protein [Peribacillus kribbensis]